VARIKEQSVEAVKAAADIVDVVQLRTPLRKQGGRYVGRCPFHEERTPSFSVNAIDKLYHCFGCGAGGDLITFVRETESLDFTGAVEWLADRFRVPLEYEEASPEQETRRRRRDRLHELLDAAASFYERYLWETEAGAQARDYLAARGLGPEICREFRLGLSPAGGRTLAAKARERGFGDDELAATGLVNRRGNDYFRGRLMFPLADARGRVVGFQARRLRDDDPLPAKYVNSPEGELFRKGSVLYGLDRARTAIAKHDRAIVVEGNTDVLALCQAGLEPVVASMGTALTERQLKDLGLLTRRVWLCFDGDAAGEAATLRGMDLAVAQGLEVKVVALPHGIDPADAADRFEGFLDDAQSYPVYRARLEVSRLLPDRQAAYLRAQEVLRPFPDSPELHDALRVVADLLELPRELQAGLAPRARAATGQISPRALQAADRLERDALAGVVAHPSLVPRLRELTRPEHFDEPVHRLVREHLVSGPGAVAPDADVVRALAELDAHAARAEIGEPAAHEYLLLLLRRGLRRELARSHDPARTMELQEALAKVDEWVATVS